MFLIRFRGFHESIVFGDLCIYSAMFISPDDSSNYNQGADICTTRSSQDATGNNGADANVHTSAVWFVYLLIA